MFPSSPSFPHSFRLFGFIVLAGAVLGSCGPSKQSAGPTDPYDLAQAAFKSGKLDKALDLTDSLATATPPTDSTERVRVLRVVIYAGQLKAAKEMAGAYSKGAEKTTSSQTRSGYWSLEHDILLNGANALMNLAGTARQIAPDGVIAKEVTLEASYPTTEGPTEIKVLSTVEDGGWIETDEQGSALADALRKGVDDALADVVGGDRAKARQALANGSTKLEGAAFAIFLARQLAEGAVVCHHVLDPEKIKALCDEGDETLKAALALLKDAPNKDQAKEVKKLQDKFKDIRKDT
ncbi:MAG: hypothetical protein WAO35_26135 [Terriglobia bacterium]